MSNGATVAFYLGPNPEAFRVLLGSLGGGHEIEMVAVVTEKELAEVLFVRPHAAAIMESCGEPVFRSVSENFPAAVIVGVVGDEATAERLADVNLFDMVIESDPGWRLLLSVRNAARLSQLLEVNNKLKRTLTRSERMLAAAAAAAGLAHEVKNRLSAVRMDLLLEYKKSGNGKKMHFLRQAAGVIDDVSSQLERILALEPDSLLEKSRGVRVDRIACRVTDLLAPLFQSAGVALERYTDVEIPPISASAAGIASVILELLTNSLKACSFGDAVRLRVVKDADNILVEISATASPAWPMQDRSKGSGLELALIERIAQAHCSQLEIETEPAGGFIFRLRLPTNAS